MEFNLNIDILWIMPGIGVGPRKNYFSSSRLIKHCGTYTQISETKHSGRCNTGLAGEDGKKAINFKL